MFISHHSNVNLKINSCHFDDERSEKEKSQMYVIYFMFEILLRLPAD